MDNPRLCNNPTPLNKLVFEFIEEAKHIFYDLDEFSDEDKKRFVNEEKGFFQFCPNQNMYLKPNLLLICDYPPPAVRSGLFNTPATKRLFTVLETLGIRALMVDRLPIAIKPALYRDTIKKHPQNLYEEFKPVTFTFNLHTSFRGY